MKSLFLMQEICQNPTIGPGYIVILAITAPLLGHISTSPTIPFLLGYTWPVRRSRFWPRRSEQWPITTVFLSELPKPLITNFIVKPRPKKTFVNKHWPQRIFFNVEVTESLLQNQRLADIGQQMKTNRITIHSLVAWDYLHQLLKVIVHS